MLNLREEITKNLEKRIKEPEELLGKGSCIPFNPSNSGTRKMMHGDQLEQSLPLMKPEVPLIETGYEDQFGEYSSSFIENYRNCVVVGKVEKFSFKPGHHYYLIVESEQDEDGNIELSVIERIKYKHISESYGYLYNNNKLDSLEVGDYIAKGEVIKKSTSFDEYDNRMSGTNLITAYFATERTMEDGIIISDYAAEKLSSPLIKNVSIVVNDNDIPLNLRGDDNNYKCLPDIGEYFSDGILYAQRREKLEDSLYTQAKSRLRQIMMSDEKFTIQDGYVLDINLKVNNPHKLMTSKYFSQLNMYYNEQLRCAKEIVDIVSEYENNMYVTLSYDLQKLYFNSMAILSGKQYIGDNKVFSNIVMDIVVMQVIPMAEGDKMSNRYGGKGVVSIIVPQELMPRLPSGEYVDCILNKDTVPNRQNFGQLFETSLNHIGKQIVQYATSGILDVSEAIDLILRYMNLVSPKLASKVNEYLSLLSDEGCLDYLASMAQDQGIYMSLDPIKDNMTLDKLNAIYKEFPFLKMNNLIVPIKGSTGKVRYVKTRRPVIAAYEYFYRLEQYAEDKFSVTSLSSTNIRNQNSRNKANRSYKALFARTPVKLGDMETGNLIHAGAYITAYVMMIYSASPQGRRLAESLLTDDPFHIDIRLDETCKNRSAEIINVYLKALGLRLKFTKKPKKLINPIMYSPIEYNDEDWNKMVEELYPTKTKHLEIKPDMIKPILYAAIDYLEDNPNKTIDDIMPFSISEK